jgi:anti-sigma factor RsiW
MTEEREAGCPEYRSRVEDYLLEGPASTGVEPDLAEHLKSCPACREAVEEGRLASEIVRGACQPYEGVSGAFVTRVMAAIREEEGRRAAGSAIWRPIEVLASRFVLAASVLLLAASFYLIEFTPPVDVPSASSQSELIGLIPEPPAQPANQDEVLMTLAEMENGY